MNLVPKFATNKIVKYTSSGKGADQKANEIIEEAVSFGLETNSKAVRDEFPQLNSKANNTNTENNCKTQSRSKKNSTNNKNKDSKVLLDSVYKDAGEQLIENLTNSWQLILLVSCPIFCW